MSGPAQSGSSPAVARVSTQVATACGRLTEAARQGSDELLRVGNSVIFASTCQVSQNVLSWRHVMWGGIPGWLAN